MVARALTPRSRPFTAAIHDLSASADAAVLLDIEGMVLFANEAWERFARLGGGFGEAPVGTRLIDAIQCRELRDVLGLALARAFRGPSPGPGSLTMESNEPDVARLVSMQFSPVLAGSEPIGLTIVRKVVRALPVSEVYEVVEGTAEGYRELEGPITQCGCCRRTRRPADPEEWDFVPALVAAPPPDTDFVYCPLCHELHNPLGSPGEEEP
jgi:hypothetical protein